MTTHTQARITPKQLQALAELNLTSPIQVLPLPNGAIRTIDSFDGVRRYDVDGERIYV